MRGRRRRLSLCVFSSNLRRGFGGERRFEPIEEKSGQIDSALRNRVAAQSISCWFLDGHLPGDCGREGARERAYLCRSNSTPFDLSEMNWERMTVRERNEVILGATTGHLDESAEYGDFWMFQVLLNILSLWSGD